VNRHFRLALCLGIAGAASAALVMPYVMALMPQVFARATGAGVGLPVIVAGQALQALVLFTLISWAGLRVGQPMELDAPLLRSFVYATPRPPSAGATLGRACALGFGCGLLIVLADLSMQRWMPAPLSAMPPAIERWKGFLAAYYGGIGEELQMRLFAMTLLAWAAWKLLAWKRPSLPPFAAWVAIVLAALAFGAAHLPAAARVFPLDAVVVLRTLLLNGIGGVAFGWLFYRHGLEHAMAAHFSADIVVHVLGA